jgi:hypothetical protein
MKVTLLFIVISFLVALIAMRNLEHDDDATESITISE